MFLKAKARLRPVAMVSFLQERVERRLTPPL